MRWFSLSSLRIRLALFLLLTMLLVLALTVFNYFKERSQIWLRIKDDVQLISYFASSSEEKFIESTRQLLVALSKVVVVKRMGAEECDSHLSEILAEDPKYANIGVLLPDGRSICSASSISSPKDYSAQEWFHTSLEHQRFVAGPGVMDGKEEEPALYFSYPLRDDSGRLQAVVFAAVDRARLDQLAFQMQLPPNAELFMASSNGTVLVYLPEPAKRMGKPADGVPLMDIVLERGKGVIEIEGLDGMRRIYAFTPLSSAVETGLFVCVGIPGDLAFGEANKSLLYHSIGLGIITILTLCVMWVGSNAFIIRRLDALAIAAQHLSGGDLGARTGLTHGEGEMGRLAKAFDDMAEAIEGREIQLREAETRYRTLVEQLLVHQDQLRSMASQLSTVEERERRIIATDLHDQVGQTLALSRIKLGLLREAAAGSEYSEQIEEIRKLVIDAIKDTRSLMFKISSPILYELGIEAALGWLAEQAQKEHGIQVDCEADDSIKPLDNDVRAFLFRAASELIVNVVKHSKARHARISVMRSGDCIRISVWDDGVGLDVEKVCSGWSGAHGFGLFSIRERLDHLGGFMEVESAPERGTTFTLVALLRRDEDLAQAAIGKERIESERNEA